MPTRDTPWPNGTPCWVDVGVPDVEAAQAFYGAVLGWEFAGGEFGGYLMVLAGGRQTGGMAPQQDPDDPPRWTTYFAADDAAATAARIRDAGGTLLLEPDEVGPMGTMAIARDPQGNPFGLWQSGLNTGVQIHEEPGALVWNEAAVGDPDAARAFYTAVFGYEWDPVDGLEGYATFRTEDRPLGGLGGLSPGLPRGWLTCFAVSSTDGTVAALEERGGKVLVPAEDTPFGRFAVVEDPWGAAFSVLQVPAGGGG